MDEEDEEEDEDEDDAEESTISEEMVERVLKWAASAKKRDKPNKAKAKVKSNGALSRARKGATVAIELIEQSAEDGNEEAMVAGVFETSKHLRSMGRAMKVPEEVWASEYAAAMAKKYDKLAKAPAMDDGKPTPSGTASTTSSGKAKTPVRPKYKRDALADELLKGDAVTEEGLVETINEMYPHKSPKETVTLVATIVAFLLKLGALKQKGGEVKLIASLLPE